MRSCCSLNYVNTVRETMRDYQGTLESLELCLRAAKQQASASPVTAVGRDDRNRERSFSGLSLTGMSLGHGAEVRPEWPLVGV